MAGALAPGAAAAYRRSPEDEHAVTRLSLNLTPIMHCKRNRGGVRD
jgi:hypothetical protein